MERVSGSIKDLELEAEKFLDGARAEANEILMKSNQESQQILTAPLALDEVKEQSATVIAHAKSEAENRRKESGRQAEALKTEAAKKVEAISDRIMKQVAGV